MKMSIIVASTWSPQIYWKKLKLEISRFVVRAQMLVWFHTISVFEWKNSAWNDVHTIRNVRDEIV